MWQDSFILTPIFLSVITTTKEWFYVKLSFAIYGHCVLLSVLWFHFYTSGTITREAAPLCSPVGLYEYPAPRPVCCRSELRLTHEDAYWSRLRTSYDFCKYLNSLLGLIPPKCLRCNYSHRPFLLISHLLSTSLHRNLIPDLYSASLHPCFSRVRAWFQINSDSSHIYSPLLCLFCCAAAVRSDFATRSEGLCEVGSRLWERGALSSPPAPAINQPIRNWPLRGRLTL